MSTMSNPTKKPETPLSLVRVTYNGTLFSPFSGQPVDLEDGPNEADDTLLFAHHGAANEYGYVSQRALSGKDISTVEGTSPREMCSELGIEGALIIEVDSGWDGVNTYAFLPARS